MLLSMFIRGILAAFTVALLPCIRAADGRFGFPGDTFNAASFWDHLDPTLSASAALPELDGRQRRDAPFLGHGTVKDAVAAAESSGDTVPRVCIVTVATGACASMEEITLPNKRAYAEKWGYRFRALLEGDEKPPCVGPDGKEARCRNDYYLKFRLVIDELDSGECDWVFWSDSDAFLGL